jgi:hypothetical protein
MSTKIVPATEPMKNRSLNISDRRGFSTSVVNRTLQYPQIMTPTIIEHPPPDGISTKWDSNIEKNVQAIGEQARGYKIMHVKEARSIGKRYSWLMYSGILLGPLAGLLSGVGEMLNPNSPTSFPIAATCIAFISGIVVAATKYGKLEELSSLHKLASSNYTSLESNVRRQLVLCRTDRIGAVKYLDWIGNSFDNLVTSSPLVTGKIYNNYISESKKRGITVPDEYKIIINVNKIKNQTNVNKIKNQTNIDKIKNQTNIDKLVCNEIKIHMNESPVRHIREIDNKKEDMFPSFKEGKLNQFSDKMMVYEMQRMFHLK